MLSQTLKKVTVVYEFLQNLFHLQDDIALIRKTHFVPNPWMNNISGSAEVRNHRYGATCESFENYACTIVTNGWKDKDISRSHASEDFAVT